MTWQTSKRALARAEVPTWRIGHVEPTDRPGVSLR